MKKWLIFIGIVFIIGYAGYKLILDYVSDKMMEQVTEHVLPGEEIDQWIKDPEIRKALEQQQSTLTSQTEQPQKPSQDTGTNPESDPAAGSGSTELELSFSSKEEALKLLLTKFTMTEIMEMASMAQGGLTSDELTLLQSKLLSRLTMDELEALKRIGLLELTKRQ